MTRAGRFLAAGAGLAVVAAGCGTSTPPTPPTSLVPPAAGSPVARHSGPVDVLYAGSLVELMQEKIGPAFKAATGYSVEGFAAGSTALAAQIKGKVRQGDVFISASPSVNADLEGPANGDWLSWYVTFAASPLVLGYNPRTRFARDLQTRPWYQVVSEPGFLLGRTDPATDPKGKLTVSALETAAKQYRDPVLAKLASSSSGVYPEETLVGRLQASQLDAGFFYTSETTAASIPAVPITGQDLKATYTVSVLRGAPDEAGALAFVEYLLGPAGSRSLRAAGFQMVEPPTASGTGVPPAVRSFLAGD